MNSVQFGGTGARVSKVAYGTDNPSNPFGTDEATSREILGSATTGQGSFNGVLV